MRRTPATQFLATQFLAMKFLATLTLLAIVGCAPSAEELARREAMAKRLVGRWAGGDWTVEFAADGTFSDEKVLSEAAGFANLATRQGRWKVIRLDGTVAVVSLNCQTSDVHGYWVSEEDGSSSWQVKVEPTDSGLRLESGWMGESWVDLTKVEDSPEASPDE
ncbi:MAG: hypothetical protein RIC55_17010 [Pirellulaceae bacterium]